MCMSNSEQSQCEARRVQAHSKPTQHLHPPPSHQRRNWAPDLLGAQRLQSPASGTTWGWVSGVYQTASSSRGPVWPGRLHVPLPARLALHRCQPSPAAGGPVGGSWHSSEAQVGTGLWGAALRPGCLHLALLSSLQGLCVCGACSLWVRRR